jgi:hypothetical protein
VISPNKLKLIGAEGHPHIFARPMFWGMFSFSQGTGSVGSFQGAHKGIFRRFSPRSASFKHKKGNTAASQHSLLGLVAASVS